MDSGFWGWTSYRFYMNCMVKMLQKQLPVNETFNLLSMSSRFANIPAVFSGVLQVCGCRLWSEIQKVSPSPLRLSPIHNQNRLVNMLFVGRPYQWWMLALPTAVAMWILGPHVDTPDIAVCYVALGVWNVYLQPENKTFNKITQLYSWKLELL